jgi:hypothetical protein
MGHRLDSRGNPIYSTSYYDVPVQTEKNRQYLSEFQSKNLLNDQIDYSKRIGSQLIGKKQLNTRLLGGIMVRK